MRTRCLLLSSVSLLLAICVTAQIDRGTLTGRVTDPSGAIMPGVEVTATHMDTRVMNHGVTNEMGLYTIPNLPIGALRIIPLSRHEPPPSAGVAWGMAQS